MGFRGPHARLPKKGRQQVTQLPELPPGGDVGPAQLGCVDRKGVLHTMRRVQ